MRVDKKDHFIHFIEKWLIIAVVLFVIIQLTALTVINHFIPENQRLTEEEQEEWSKDYIGHWYNGTFFISMTVSENFDSKETYNEFVNESENNSIRNICFVAGSICVAIGIVLLLIAAYRERKKKLLEGNTPIMQEETKEVKAPETLNDSVVNNVGVSNNVVANNGVQKLVEEQKFTDQKTLNDIALLTELKSKDGLDNVLKEFAIKEETGLLDFNVALNKVVGNTIREVERSISSRTDFSSDLTKYDIQGNFIGELIQADSSPDEKIMKGFQNIMKVFKKKKMR